MTVKVFCSHRGVDKPEVEAFARRLRDSGIDAWFDRQEDPSWRLPFPSAHRVQSCGRFYLTSGLCIQ